MGTLKRHSPFFAALLITLAGVVLLLLQGLRIGEGDFAYALDDCYIHLSIARTLLQSGSWGIEPGVFNGTSSSPVYTLLLTAWFTLTGVGLVSPVLLNLLFGVGILFTVEKSLNVAGASATMRFAMLAVLLFIGPLMTMMALAMEAVLFALLALLFLKQAVAHLTEPRSRRSTVLLLILAILMIGTRYEGLSLGMLTALLLLLKRRWLQSILLGIVCLTPVVGYALFSLSQGGMVLPNAFFTDSSINPDMGLSGWVVEGLIEPLRRNEWMTMTVALALFSMIYRLRRDPSPWQPGVIASLLYGVATLAHLMLSATSNAYRHEFYLFANAPMIAGSTWLPDLFQGYRSIRPLRVKWLKPVLWAMILLLLSPLIRDGYERLWFVAHYGQATENIQNQQVQTARFFREHFQGEAVAIHDIGAPSYFTNCRIIDLYGLACEPIMWLKLHGRYDAASASEIVRESGAPVAVVFDDWMDKYGGIPDGWILAGRLTIPGNLVSAFDTVSIYATSPETLDRVLYALQQFATQLPDDVVRTGMFLNPD